MLAREYSGAPRDRPRAHHLRAQRIVWPAPILHKEEIFLIKVTDMLARARQRTGPTPAQGHRSSVPPAPTYAAPVQQTAQIRVHPPEIPPMVPPPKPRTGIYSDLMKKHDRVATRHIP